MSKEAIDFHRWMMKNDTMENADKYFHWSDEDMFKEFLKHKNPTNSNDIPHSDIRRMESEGVYEEKFQRNSSKSPTYFNEEWNQSNKFDNDDESKYADGVDERPIKKEVEYNDDEFDY